MIKALIFDFAGVISTDGYWAWLRKQIPNLAEKQSGQKDFFQNLCDEVDSGHISNAAYIKKLSLILGIKAEDIWPAVFPNYIINRKLLDLIIVLKRKYKIGLLSNFTHEWLEEILEKHHL